MIDGQVHHRVGKSVIVSAEPTGMAGRPGGVSAAGRGDTWREPSATGQRRAQSSHASSQAARMAKRRASTCRRARGASVSAMERPTDLEGDLSWTMGAGREPNCVTESAS